MTYDSLFSLVYLKAFIDETFRLNNRGQMVLFREALCDTYVENIKVKNLATNTSLITLIIDIL